MNFKLSGLAAAAALFTGFTVFSGFPGSASAASVRYANVGNWSIYSNETYCTATAEYEDDASLQFNVATNGAANIVIWNPRWKIPKGSHRVVVSVDRAPPTTFQAEADGYHVSLPWELTEDQINLVSNGVVFRAIIGREVYAFNLAGSRETLQALGRCVAQISPSAANPFASQPPAASASPSNPFAETPSNPYRRM